MPPCLDAKLSAVLITSDPDALPASFFAAHGLFLM